MSLLALFAQLFLSVPSDAAATFAAPVLHTHRMAEVDLQALNLRALPVLPVMLPRVRAINLAGNQFTRVPSLAAFPALEHLDVTANRLSVIKQNEVTIAPTLRSLAIGHNDLTHVDLSCEHFPQLEAIDAEENRLPVFTTLAGCDALEVLNLRNNRLETVPEGVRHLPALRWIDLSENPIPLRAITDLRRARPDVTVVF